MNIHVLVGDIFEIEADVLVCPANVEGNLSGGIGGELLLRGGESVQAELFRHMQDTGAKHFLPGSVWVTTAAPLVNFRAIFHAVAIDAFYNSNSELVARAITAVFDVARRNGFQSIALPALATGFGRLSMSDFAAGLSQALSNCDSDLFVNVVLRQEIDSLVVASGLNSYR